MKISITSPFRNRDGSNTSWFQTRPASLGNGRLVMTMQPITGSDHYGAVVETTSEDSGEHWSAPQPVPGFECEELSGGVLMGICDVVPEYHAPTDTVLAIGHNVYYRDGGLLDTLGDWNANAARPDLPRYPVWGVRDNRGRWIRQRRKLELVDSDNMSIYSCNCSQRLFRGDTELIVPLTWGLWGRMDRMFSSLRVHYDGRELTVLERGNTLELPVGRGLMEPSLTEWDNRILVTLRTEDNSGYFAESVDGVQWGPLRKWEFDDGTVPVMYNTQQHWLRHCGRLYLIYNRKMADNQHLMRYRTPLLIAEVAPETMKLRRSTETIIFPMLPETQPDGSFLAALMGNFHPVQLSETESLVAVGENRYYDHYRGDTLIARISGC